MATREFRGITYELITGTDGIDSLARPGPAALPGENSYLEGLGGNDDIFHNSSVGFYAVLDGGPGADRMFGGGSGTNMFIVDNEFDVVRGGAGLNLVFSSSSYAVPEFDPEFRFYEIELIGTADINALGNTVPNILLGNSGSNILDGGFGADIMRGGLGDDVYVVDNLNDHVTELAGEGTDLIETSTTYNAPSNVENITILSGRDAHATGNELDNTLIGNSGINYLSGLAGQDLLVAGVGADVLNGGEGHDELYGEIGQDTLIGGAGDDISFGGDGFDVLFGDGGNDELYGGADQDYLFSGAGTNTLSGDDGGDVLHAEGANDTLYGGDGGDHFYSFPGATLPTASGGNGNDIYVDLSGGAGSQDTFHGEAGQDYCYGFGGNDVFFGGAGVDVFLGGAGNDIFDGGADVDYAWGEAGNDTFITRPANGHLVLSDFTPGGTDDVVRLQGGFTNFSQVLVAMTYYGSLNTTIFTIDADTNIWFIGVHTSQFTASDFLFM